MELINKAVMMAEIERLRKNQSLDDRHGQGVLDGLHAIERFLDTLEVKEIDLENELDKFYGMYRKDGQTFSLEDNEECVDWKVDCNPKFEKSFAKHFYELGIAVSNKAQKGEEA